MKTKIYWAVLSSAIVLAMTACGTISPPLQSTSETTTTQSECRSAFKSFGRTDDIKRFGIKRQGQISVIADDRQTAYDCGRAEIYAERTVYRYENRNTPDDKQIKTVLQMGYQV